MDNGSDTPATYVEYGSTLKTLVRDLKPSKDLTVYNFLQDGGCVIVLDLREWEEFSKGFIRNSFFIGSDNSYQTPIDKLESFMESKIQFYEERDKNPGPRIPIRIVLVGNKDLFQERCVGILTSE